MLGGLAMKWRWRQRQEAAGRPTDRPNMVLGSNVQVVWEKFCKYWDVEPRYVPVAHDRYVVDPDDVMARVDENTIGVIPILGTTFTGEFEPIKEIHDRVVAYNEEHGLDVPIHVDAASGGFVAPFLHPDLEWDFRLPQVKSINVSGHKYGLTYPGIGFVVWRSQDDLPERPRLPRQLPRRRHADLHAELLPARQPARSASTTTSSASDARASRASWSSCVTSPCTCRARSRAWGRSRWSATAPRSR